MRIRLTKRDTVTREKKIAESLDSRLRDNSLAIVATFDDNQEIIAEITLNHDDILDLYLHAHRQHEEHLKIF